MPLFIFIEKSRKAVLEKVGKVIITDKNKYLIDALSSLLLQFEIIKFSQHAKAKIKNIRMGQQYLITVSSLLDKSEHCGIHDDKRVELLMELSSISSSLLAFLNSEQDKLEALGKPHSILEDHSSTRSTPIKTGNSSSANTTPGEQVYGSDTEEEFAVVVTPLRP